MKHNHKRKVQPDVLKELNFLESLSRRCPRDTEILKALGDLYTRVERYEEGLNIDRALSRLCPHDPLVWYNLACSYALVNRTDEALSALSRAIDRGYNDYHWIRKDDDFESIRKDQRFKVLLQRLISKKNPAYPTSS